MNKNSTEYALKIIFLSDGLTSEQSAAFICKLSEINYSRLRMLARNPTQQHEDFLKVLVQSAGFFFSGEYLMYKIEFEKSEEKLNGVFKAMADRQRAKFVLLLQLFMQYCDKIGDDTSFLQGTVSTYYEDIGIDKKIEILAVKQIEEHFK